MIHKEDKNTCVRISRDEPQLWRCKERITNLDTEIIKLAQVLQLAGNVVRMKILILLRDEERLCVCDLAEVLEMKIPAVSQHLRKLKDGKLLRTEREGNTIYYSVYPNAQPVLSSILSNISAFEVA